MVARRSTTVTKPRSAARSPARWRRSRHYRPVLRGAGTESRRQQPRRSRVERLGLLEVARALWRPAMKPAAFDYVRAESLDEALEVLRNEGGDARIIAGGQSLMPILNMRLAKPRVLVDIMRLEELRKIEPRRGRIAVGAAVRQAELLEWPSLDRELNLLSLTLPWTGHVQTRSRGTICGSIAHADPSAELPLALLALGGEIVLRSAKKRRRVAARDFFRGVMTTDRNDDELIEAVEFPATDGGRCGFREVA